MRIGGDTSEGLGREENREKEEDSLLVCFLGHTVKFHFVGTGRKLKERFYEFFSFFRCDVSSEGEVKSIFVRDRKWATFLSAVRKALLYFINKLKEEPSVAILHGAAVYKNGVVFCFLGGRRRGKSTSCKIFAQAGFNLISEDTLFLDVARGEFITFPKPIMLKGPSGRVKKVLIARPAEEKVKPKVVLAILLSQRIRQYRDFKSFSNKMRKLAHSKKSAISQFLSGNSAIFERVGGGGGIEFLVRQIYNFNSVDRKKFLKFVSSWKFLRLL